MATRSPARPPKATLTANDEGAEIFSIVTATNAAGSGNAMSDHVGPIEPAS